MNIWLRKVYGAGGSKVVTIPGELKELTEASFVIFKVREDGTIILEPFDLEERILQQWTKSGKNE